VIIDVARDGKQNHHYDFLLKEIRDPHAQNMTETSTLWSSTLLVLSGKSGDANETKMIQWSLLIRVEY
jgi:hypothetical protein